ncbi:unnamed protein product [Cuscuta campestris]|uniref:Uncharacterized protein n=1 Tax=Cuscuta campestris TaxID=132261 RepID=A0A484KJ20_9ASTE|nr:unnamed protein product [Cuscuta campestris]
MVIRRVRRSKLSATIESAAACSALPLPDLRFFRSDRRSSGSVARSAFLQIRSKKFFRCPICVSSNLHLQIFFYSSITVWDSSIWA